MCDTIVIKLADRVLFAKNSDRDPNEAQYLCWVPAAEHPAGASVRCTWIEIPQVRRTNAVLLSRPFWIWGAEIGANEHGLVIGNEAVFTRRRVARSGLTGMDLIRLALERAVDAQEALQLIVGLIREHGQGGGCGHEQRSFRYHNSFVVADRTQAFVLETAENEHAIEPVDTARTISNALSIPGFAERHSDRLYTAVAQGRERRELTQQLAASARGPADLFALLRSHGRERTAPRYRWHNGALAAPCAHAGGLLTGSQTTASWVAELTPQGARHWVTATSAPCTGLFKPVNALEPLELGPAPTDRFDARCLWWRHELLHRSVMRDHERLLLLFAAERDELEAEWLARPPEPRAAFKRADELLSQWTAAVRAAAGADKRPALVRRYWKSRDKRVGLGNLTDIAI